MNILGTILCYAAPTVTLLWVVVLILHSQFISAFYGGLVYPLGGLSLLLIVLLAVTLVIEERRKDD
jgi:hypothetical protein